MTLLTVKEAAQRLNLSVGWLNKRRCSGGGPLYVKIGRIVRYDPAELDRWLQASRRESTIGDCPGDPEYRR